MKAAPARALLFVAGLALIAWGLAPSWSAPVTAAPALLVTETSTAEPATLTPTATTTPVNPPPPITNTPTSTPTSTPSATPEPDESDDPDDPDPTATPEPTLTPTAAPAPPPADPAISKSVSPPTALVGDTVTYTILVTNLGGSPATGVVVEDALPAFLLPTGVSTSRGTATISGQLVRAEIGELAPGETVEIRVTATVVATATAPDNRNLARVSSTSPDGNPDNNEASVPVDATGPVSLPNTGAADSALPLAATLLGLALVAGSLLVRRRR